MTSTDSFVWPEGYRAAISLTFDDGLPTQRKVAAPRLEETGFRGTFYLNPRGERWQDRLAPWQPVQAAGHEIGNHTMAHPCSLNTTPVLQSWTVQQIRDDVQEAQRRLDLSFPDQGERSFAYPCYESDVGRGRTRQSYVPVIAEHFIAGRARGTSMQGNHPVYADLCHLSSWSAERMSAWEMIGLVDQCLTEGWWGILTFHGVNQGHLPISEHDLCGLLDYLERRQAHIWTAPVVQVARAILDQTGG